MYAVRSEMLEISIIAQTNTVVHMFCEGRWAGLASTKSNWLTYVKKGDSKVE